MQGLVHGWTEQPWASYSQTVHSNINLRQEKVIGQAKKTKRK